MTIFDSIKYPVSNPPTGDQIRNLPEEIYIYWFRNYYSNIKSSEGLRHDIVLLQKLIFEYNTDDCKIRKYYDNIR